MRTTLVLWVAVTLMVMTGCGPLTSLQPLWDEGHQVVEPALEGTWMADEDDEILVVTRAKDQSLRMKYISTDGIARYEVHALKLGETLFLDLSPDDSETRVSSSGDVYMPCLPLHFFARVEQSGEALKLSVLDEDAVSKKIKSGKIRIGSMDADGTLVLTATTRELQEFIARHASDSELWGETASWHRR
jgi:hypothetical protein